MKRTDPKRALKLALTLAIGLPALANAATSMLPFEAPGTTWAEHPELAGTVIDRRTDTYSFNEAAGNPITGEIESLVVRESASGALAFYWRVSSASDSFWGISTVSGMGDMGHSAGWLSEGFGSAGGVRPLGWTGNEFYFGFDSSYKIKPGTQSTYMFVRTDATSYDLTGGIGLKTDMQRTGPYTQPLSPYYTTFGPVGMSAAAALPVPEPQTWAMVAAGLALTAFATRRRRAARAA